MFGANQVMNDVGAGSITAAITKPLLTDVAHDNGRRFANSAVSTAMGSQILVRNLIIVLFLELQLIETCSNCIDLAVRDSLSFQLIEAIQLKKRSHN